MIKWLRHKLVSPILWKLSEQNETLNEQSKTLINITSRQQELENQITTQMLKLTEITEALRKIDEHHMNECPNKCAYPAGHYYSPIPDIEDVIANESKIFNNDDGLAGIDFNVDKQISLLQELSKFFTEHPFSDEKNHYTRYYFNNNFFTKTDGLILYSIMRHFQPKKIIEVGSGFSSCMMLDVNQLCFSNGVDLTFIEPFPERFLENVKTSDNYTLYKEKVQDVGMNIFCSLKRDDILFIDSSHVSKTGSDVNHLFLRIIPQLNSGVIIHIHDIFFPFEYPKQWVVKGWAWNEIYFLRALLVNNRELEVLLFCDYLVSELPSEVKTIMNDNEFCKTQAGSIWLRKK